MASTQLEKALLFQQKAIERFGKDKAIIHLDTYVDRNVLCSFTCIVHNEKYEQRPNNFMSSYNGCKTCKKEKKEQLANTLRHTKESLLVAYNKKHNGYYSYENNDFSKYKDWKSIITITCPVHRRFLSRI